MSARMSTAAEYEVIRAGASLGEGILWDSRRGVLWWTDIHGRALHRYDWSGGTPEVLTAPDRIGSFGLVAGSERLIAAFADGIAYYSPVTREVEWLARPAEVSAGVRFNDGRIDRAGRFWVGTMKESEPRTASGGLYSFDRSKGLRCHVRDVRISNSLCMSPDGAVLYFADSMARTIWAYDLVEPAGELRNRRVFAETPKGVVPDGATVDADGCVWSAQWGGSRVVRYAPDGQTDRIVAVPTRQPSCVCFGGPNLDVLCVTSARVELDAAALAAEPHAGDVFLYRVGTQGLPEPEYRP